MKHFQNIADQHPTAEIPLPAWEPIPLELELPLPYNPLPSTEASKPKYQIIEIDLA